MSAPTGHTVGVSICRAASLPSLLLDPVGVSYLAMACNPWLRYAATGFDVEHLRCSVSNRYFDRLIVIFRDRNLNINKPLDDVDVSQAVLR